MTDIAFDSFYDFDKKKKNSGSKVKVLKILFTVLLSLLLLEMMVYIFVIPCLGNVRIKLTGLETISDREIISLCREEFDKNYLKFDKEAVCTLIANLPSVEKVSVQKVFPDKVYINIVERTPVALTFLNDSEKTVPVQIDKDGMLFPVKSPDFQADKTVPIVSGIPLENRSAGMKIPAEYTILIDRIAEIQEKNREYFTALSEIHVVPGKYGNFELLLFPIDSKLRVFADRIFTVETLKKMMVTLDAVSSLNSSDSVIDLRYGSISYHSSSSELGR